MAVICNRHIAAQRAVTAERGTGCHAHCAGRRLLIAVNQQNALLHTGRAGVVVVAGQRQRTGAGFSQTAVYTVYNAADAVIEIQRAFDQLRRTQHHIPRTGKRTD